MTSSIFLAALATVLSMTQSPPPTQFGPSQIGSWTITDEGSTCEAFYSVDGEQGLRLTGPTHGWTDGPSGGVFHHTGYRAGQYSLSAGESPVDIIAGSSTYSGIAQPVEMDGSLLAFAGDPPVHVILAGMPDAAPLAFQIGGRELLRFDLTGVHQASQVFEQCLAFINAQKRPGTKFSDQPPPPPPLLLPLPDLELPGENLPTPETEPRAPSVPPHAGDRGHQRLSGRSSERRNPAKL